MCRIKRANAFQTDVLLGGKNFIKKSSFKEKSITGILFFSLTQHFRFLENFNIN
jgi:hypothetical protein